MENRWSFWNHFSIFSFSCPVHRWLSIRWVIKWICLKVPYIIFFCFRQEASLSFNPCPCVVPCLSPPFQISPCQRPSKGGSQKSEYPTPTVASRKKDSYLKVTVIYNFTTQGWTTYYCAASLYNNLKLCPRLQVQLIETLDVSCSRAKERDCIETIS